MSATSDAVKAWAAELGFLACGITDLAPNAHAAEFDRWLAAGYAGTMRYLHRQARKRRAPQLIDTDATRAVVVLDSYHHDDSVANAAPPRVAKYARGRDYHEILPRRLEQLAARLRDQGARVARVYADAGPVPERELARRAGLGWIGKNAMLIRPGAGSFFFIGEILTDLPLAVDDEFRTDHCGSCTRCLDACPTDAIVEPGVVDATRCISYLTIEQRGPIPGPHAARLEGWAFGCDICNDVCPWNARFAAGEAPDYPPLDLLAGAPADTFERMDEAEFARRFGDTPFARPGLAGMRRNFRAAFTPHTATRDA